MKRKYCLLLLFIYYICYNKFIVWCAGRMGTTNSADYKMEVGYGIFKLG